MSDRRPLPDVDPAQMSMRIAPRTMLCVTDWLERQGSRSRFAELRELCNAAGDKVSLAIGMSGLASELLYAERPGEASRLVHEQTALLEAIGDPNLTVGLSFGAFANWFNSGEFGQIARWSQIVIDQANGDPAIGAGFGLGSPLALALTFRGIARWWLGRGGWQQDFGDAVAMGRTATRRPSASSSRGPPGWGSTGSLSRRLRSGRGGRGDAAGRRGAVMISHSQVQIQSGDCAPVSPCAGRTRRGLELLVHARDVSLPSGHPRLPRSPLMGRPGDGQAG